MNFQLTSKAGPQTKILAASVGKPEVIALYIYDLPLYLKIDLGIYILLMYYVLRYVVFLNIVCASIIHKYRGGNSLMGWNHEKSKT